MISRYSKLHSVQPRHLMSIPIEPAIEPKSMVLLFSDIKIQKNCMRFIDVVYETRQRSSLANSV